jgi:hypothetical protein
MTSVVNKVETSLIDDTRVAIYDRHMFIAQATDEIDQRWQGHPSLKQVKDIKATNLMNLRKINSRAWHS